jgi:ribosomal protein S18 acetylase RimI-like enzyme
MPPPAELLPWDSEFFGVRIARAANGRLTSGYLAEMESWCDHARVRCLYFLADSDHAETVQLAQQFGFTLVDIRLTLERTVSRRLGKPQPPPGVMLRPAAFSDLPTLQKIAADAYTQSRFYFDARFPREACSRLYQVWVQKALAENSDAVLVAEFQGLAAGFVACSPAQGGAAGKINLIGIASAARGMGIGWSLVRQACRWLAEHGAQSAEVVTQGRNIAAQRLYQRAGFTTKEVCLWYHKWYER